MQDTPFNDPHVRESVKVAEIKDDFAMTRFKVILTDFDDFEIAPDHDNLRDWDRSYQVEVMSYCYGPDPLVLVSKTFDDHRVALSFFKQNVAIYTDLVKVETRHYQDIEIYRDRIDYKIADCCASCKWAMKNPDPRSRKRIVCGNEDLFKLPRPDFNPEEPVESDKRMYDINHGHGDCRHSFQPVFPEVNSSGICKAFIRYKKEIGKRG